MLFYANYAVCDSSNGVTYDNRAWIHTHILCKIMHQLHVNNLTRISSDTRLQVL